MQKSEKKSLSKAVFENTPILPMTRQEMKQLGWSELDILLVSGDAYIDHPSFGVSLLGRWLVEHGFRVGVIAQPEWQGAEKNISNSLSKITDMGRPKLFAGVSAGAIDSMLAHYTAFRKKRHDDAYTPGGKNGSRPNRATIIYSNLLRQNFKDIPIVLGGIEASLRRITHYDFWTDALRLPLLCDAKADVLIYGMGEKAILELANKAKNALAKTQSEFLLRKDFVDVAKYTLGTAFISSGNNADDELKIISDQASNKEEYTIRVLPSLNEIKLKPELLIQSALTLEEQVHQADFYCIEKIDDKRNLILAPPQDNLTTSELDLLYGLAFSRLAHPLYKEPIPAWEMIRTSITSHRGCGGACSFCSLSLHQGRKISSRSSESILQELDKITFSSQTSKNFTNQTKIPKWASSISDVGGPSANMWQAVCTFEQKKCLRKSCMFPGVCKFFKIDQMQHIKLLRQINQHKNVNNVRVASGIRLDLALNQTEALEAYAREFTGGLLKIAPEHICEHVLTLMRKPTLERFEAFLERFQRSSEQAKKEQYIIPYLMSAFPGCEDKDMLMLKKWLAQKRWTPKQVQCFIPTPGTVATGMFYSKKDCDGNNIYVARSDADRMRQHYILIQGSEKRSK
ncbi:YgiQ family radical SAM protein [Desulfovibrio litoralis]|uniref:Uncharacterized radical SAM protein YgiQ n=1 Tax=Desulfovibrio litoralis DSM 11393 TaxID=1121455 RepID=A0A1M7RWS4_9BACT|nr:YgiQ family radical SAM protein [Desulfovibrio litoralis]SHN50733.1 uncharacterized radical SAM protein YgiQ [Desulfovibrio litoralis DSM 11393]